MSRNPVSVGGRPDATDIRQELLGRLGLQDSATDQDVETAHDGLIDFLELAPSEVKSWATARSADVDKAFALLSGPEENLVAEVTSPTQDLVAETFLSPAAAPVTVAKSAGIPPFVPAPPFTPAKASFKSRRNLLVAAIVAVILVVVFAVWYMGRASDVPGISGKPTNATTAAAQPTAVPLDQAKVAALMQKITANPKDLVSLAGLGDLYFASSDYKNAEVWEQKVLGVDPKNQKGLLAIGAAQFNQGNSVGAKKNWLVAAGLYPKSQEVHYDLGFLYMSATPPDTANMTAEWAKVVAIDPNSALAKTVGSHVKSTSPTATPTAK